VDVFFRYARIDAWDGEEAWAKLNGKKHWKYAGKASVGSRQCGKKEIRDGLWRIRMRDVHITGRKLKLEIGSDLKADPDVASFGIKTVTVKAKCIGESTRRGKKFKITLGSKNGVPTRKYEFVKVQSSQQDKRFSHFMRKTCERYGMKPVCDHKTYCKKDTRSLFLGQSHHLAYPPHRENTRYVPEHFQKIAKRWDGLCTYTGNQGNGKALCNIPKEKHQWKRMQEDDADAFMCGRIASFKATLQAFGDVPERTYEFRIATTDKREKRFSKVMIDVCGELGMKPICDHPKYCKKDKAAIYLGQKKHISFQPHRMQDKLFPPGWNAELKAAFDGLCTYTGKQGSGKALCNVPLKKHEWRHMADDTNSFMCARVLGTKVMKERAPHLKRMILENLELWSRIGVNEEKIDFPTKYHAKLPKGTSIESISKFGRPVTVTAEVMSAKESCLSFSIFNTDRADDGGLMMSPGSGESKKEIKFFPSKAMEVGKKLDQWRTLEILALANGTTKFFLDSKLYSKTDEGKAMRDGRILVKATCDKMEIRNVKRSMSPLYIRISNRNLFINAKGGSTKGAVSKLKDCKKEDNLGTCQWWLEKSNSKKNHYYIRVSDSNLFLRASDTESGADVKLHSCPASADSAKCQWEVIPSLTKEGFHYIKMSGEDLFLIADGDGKEMSKVVLGKCNFDHDMENCQWKLEGWKGGLKKAKRFTATLEGKNGVATRKYVFQKLTTDERLDAWSPFMTKECSYLGMRPVCDHPKYCKADTRSLYIGQDKHLAYPKHRKDETAVPHGFHKIQKAWNGVCSFTGKHGSGKALCNIPSRKHAWYKMGKKGASSFICGEVAPFLATLVGSGDRPGFKYEFRVVTTYRRDGSFREVMLKECKQHGMKPVCDDPKFCAKDKEGLYIGHQGHISSPQNCKKMKNFPIGWEKLRQNFKGMCFYAGKEGAGKAMCNIPSKTHRWQKLSDKASTFMCAKVLKEKDVKHYVKGSTFEAVLGPRESHTAKFKFRFRKMKVYEQGVNFTKLMVAKCKEIGMRPVCDHPKYCESDSKSLYIGQDKHLAYPMHRKKKYVPWGFSEIADKWNGVCSYTGKHGAGKALCNIPSKTHSWKELQQDGANSFICGKILGIVLRFTKTLGARGEVPKREYEFLAISTHKRERNFNKVMIDECDKHHMRPVCDHKKFCTDEGIYLGQEKHIAFPVQRRKKKYFPHGWDKRMYLAFSGLCLFTGEAGGGKAMCNFPAKTHSWQPLSDKTSSFMCAKILKTQTVKLRSFTAVLDEFDGIPMRTYAFQIATVPQSYYGENFSTVMIATCRKLGMKPVCDHPQYCANNVESLYLGQRRHIAFPPQRENPSYFPNGWLEIKEFWKGLCSYTGASGAGKALCNFPSKTHSWRRPGEISNAIMCGRIEKEAKLAPKTTPSPTPCPTHKPTLCPTQLPTNKAPSEIPTISPTSFPTVKNTTRPTLQPKGCDEQLRDHNDEGYRGCQDSTISGYECQKWTDQTPHSHKSATPKTTPGRGLGDHNFCRNADNSRTIWCLTTNPKKRIEQCEPKEKIGRYTMLQGDCSKIQAIKTYPECSENCCKQRCDRDTKCKGFSHHAESDICIIRSEDCKRQPGKCDSSKEGNAGFCFFQKGVAKMKNYHYYELRGDCEGNLIHSKKDISRKDCEKACTKMDDCAGFSYNNDEMFCDLRTKSCDHRRGKCLVKQCFWVKNRPRFSKETVHRNLAPGCKKMEFGVEYLGQHLRKIDRVSSAIKCNAHCVENKKCVAWVWGMAKGTPSSNICFLKKSLKKKRKNPHYVSGIPDRGGHTKKKLKKEKKKTKTEVLKQKKATKIAMIDGYARLKRSQRLERVQVIRRVKRQQKLSRYRAMQKMRATQALRRLGQMRKLRTIQKKVRNLYLCRMRGECPMPNGEIVDKKSTKYLKKSHTRTRSKKKSHKYSKKVAGMKKMLKDLKKKKKRLKKDKKKLNKLLKVEKTVDDGGDVYVDPKSLNFDGLQSELNSAADGAIKVDDDKDFQQFKQELFDDYGQSGAREIKNGAKDIKRRMKHFLHRRPHSSSGPHVPRSVKRKIKRQIKHVFHSGAGSSGHLYDGIWNDHDVQLNVNHRRVYDSKDARSKSYSKKHRLGGSFDIGFDTDRRKL